MVLSLVRLEFGRRLPASGLPAVVKLLLASMVLFNIGFYLVVPYLAVHMSENLGFGAAMVGLVLGLRTFSQQGMFFIGGSIGDRLGRRPVILWGIAVRIIGFAILAVADNTAAVVLGVLSIGFAAALFAPAVESANADFGRELERDGVIRRTELFGWEQMASRLGTVIGPALGAVLLVFPFAVSAAAAAALFAGLWVCFYFLFPARDATSRPVPLGVVWATVITNRTFMKFAALCSIQFVAIAQLYLMLPEQLDRTVGSQSALGWFYVGAAVLVIVGQRPMVRVADRLGRRVAIIGGMALMSASFVIPAVPVGTSYLALAGWVAVLYLGQMLMVPTMRDTLAVIADEQHLGAHFGMLSTIGGILALAGTVGIGYLFDHAATAVPWLAAAAVTAVVTLLTWWWSRSIDFWWPLPR
ncbi:multidrug transporter [Rhodococcus sp. CUA-806]|nr:multidrug transporter [Rhodococcus sp. CUA-806]